MLLGELEDPVHAPGGGKRIGSGAVVEARVVAASPFERAPVEVRHPDAAPVLARGVERAERGAVVAGAVQRGIGVLEGDVVPDRHVRVTVVEAEVVRVASVDAYEPLARGRGCLEAPRDGCGGARAGDRRDAVAVRPCLVGREPHPPLGWPRRRIVLVVRRPSDGEGLVPERGDALDAAAGRGERDVDRDLARVERVRERLVERDPRLEVTVPSDGVGELVDALDLERGSAHSPVGLGAEDSTARHELLAAPVGVHAVEVPPRAGPVAERDLCPVGRPGGPLGQRPGQRRLSRAVGIHDPHAGATGRAGIVEERDLRPVWRPLGKQVSLGARREAGETCPVGVDREEVDVVVAVGLEHDLRAVGGPLRRLRVRAGLEQLLPGAVRVDGEELVAAEGVDDLAPVGRPRRHRLVDTVVRDLGATSAVDVDREELEVAGRGVAREHDLGAVCRDVRPVVHA